MNLTYLPTPDGDVLRGPHKGCSAWGISWQASGEDHICEVNTIDGCFVSFSHHVPGINTYLVGQTNFRFGGIKSSFPYLNLVGNKSETLWVQVIYDIQCIWWVQVQQIMHQTKKKHRVLVSPSQN